MRVDNAFSSGRFLAFKKGAGDFNHSVFLVDHWKSRYQYHADDVLGFT